MMSLAASCCAPPARRHSTALRESVAQTTSPPSNAPRLSHASSGNSSRPSMSPSSKGPSPGCHCAEHSSARAPGPLRNHQP